MVGLGTPKLPDAARAIRKRAGLSTV